MPLLSKSEVPAYFKSIRPTLGYTTIKTYSSLVWTLYTSEFRNAVKLDTDWFPANQDRIVELIKDKPRSTKTSILTAVLVLISNPEQSLAIQESFKAEKTILNEQYDSGIMTPRQRENWIPYGAMIGMWNEKMRDSKHLFEKENLNYIERNALNEFMLMTLCIGRFFPPRRLEWLDMKLRNYNPEKDNWIDWENNRFVINVYKTQAKYGTQYVPFNDECAQLLKRFIARTDNGSDYLLSNSKGGRFPASRGTTMLNSMFGKNVGVDLIRHAYKTYHNPNQRPLGELKKEAAAMGHSVATGITYVLR